MRLPISLVCLAALVTTAPASGGKSKRKCGVSILSKLHQSGSTSGGGAVSAHGKTQGSARFRCRVQGPGFLVDSAGVGSAGVSGTGVSSGLGAFDQDAAALTEIISKPGGSKVLTLTEGKGSSGGTAGVLQKAGASGGVSKKKIGILQKNFLKGLVTAVKKVKAQGTSSSGHTGSSTGFGDFKFKGGSVTDIKLPSAL
nr:CP19k-like protein 2 [Chthamalus malayensis]